MLSDVIKRAAVAETSCVCVWRLSTVNDTARCGRGYGARRAARRVARGGDCGAVFHVSFTTPRRARSRTSSRLARPPRSHVVSSSSSAAAAATKSMAGQVARLTGQCVCV